MKTTNKHNLPSPFIQQAELRELEPKRIWVTQLIDSPLIRQLRLKHHDDLVVDAEECVTALTGAGGHSVLEQAGKRRGNCIVEEKCVDEIAGWTLVGITDLWEDGTITDYKFCKVWKYIFKDTKQFEQQLNILAWQWQYRGIKVTGIQAQAIFVDWMQKKAGQDGYPPNRHHLFKLPLWDGDRVSDYILQRLELHSEPAEECTPEEKWEKPTTWAVMRKGRKTALRVLDSERNAHKWIDQKTDGKDISTVERKGECIRCENYCSVRNVCPYRNKNETNNPTTDSRTA